MALYTYQVLDKSGKVVSGSMDARDEKALADILQEKGCFPIKISKPEEKWAAKDILPQIFPSKITSKQILQFTQQFTSMLAAGLQIDRSLTILIELEENPSLKKILHELLAGIKEGKPLAECMSLHPNVFSGIYINMVKAGEASGSLDVVMDRVRNYLEESQRLKDEIFSALIYPSLLTLVGGLAVSVLLLFVIPRFSEIFKDMGGTLPLPTQILMSISGSIVNYWWIIIASILVIILLVRGYIRTDSGKMLWDSLKLKMPVTKSVYIKTIVSRFSRTLGTLLQSGLPILEAIRIARDTVGNIVIARAINPVIEGVKRGRGLAKPLKETAKFPPLAIHIITVGEETGKLDEMLIKLAENFDNDIRNSMKGLISLIEPALILVMGAVVAFIVFAMLLAIFSLSEIPM
ncbi:MAG: type II secretion system F family protein [Deltaproteobacteria bacterium]|nr:type II secretion system F family protein [Deltaproteobacteria bacterium]